MLTQKEQILFDRIKEGMDQPGEGWLHEMLPEGMSAHSAAGVLGSLISKGLVTSVEDKEGPVVCYWVELAKPRKTT